MHVFPSAGWIRGLLLGVSPNSFTDGLEPPLRYSLPVYANHFTGCPGLLRLVLAEDQMRSVDLYVVFSDPCPCFQSPLGEVIHREEVDCTTTLFVVVGELPSSLAALGRLPLPVRLWSTSDTALVSGHPLLSDPC